MPTPLTALSPLTRSRPTCAHGATDSVCTRSPADCNAHVASTTSHFTWLGAWIKMAFRLRLPARGGRRRKRLRCALRACRPGLRRSAGSTILRGSPSSTDRLPAPRFRCSRGPAQRALQSTAVVQLEVDTSSTRAVQSISGACCTSPRTSFCFTSVLLLCRTTARRRLLMLIRTADDALGGSSCSGATWSIYVRYARCGPCPLGTLSRARSVVM